MKYKLEIVINKNIDKVVSAFDSTENMYKWMKGLKELEHISGTPGEVNAKSKLTFLMNKRKMEMIETINVKNLPDEFTATYEAKGVVNISKNIFVSDGEDKTKYISEQEFQFKGFIKIMALIFPAMFKKQSLQYMNDFKEFVESNNV